LSGSRNWKQVTGWRALGDVYAWEKRGKDVLQGRGSGFFLDEMQSAVLLWRVRRYMGEWGGRAPVRWKSDSAAYGGVWGCGGCAGGGGGVDCLGIGWELLCFFCLWMGLLVFFRVLGFCCWGGFVLNPPTHPTPPTPTYTPPPQKNKPPTPPSPTTPAPAWTPWMGVGLKWKGGIKGERERKI